MSVGTTENIGHQVQTVASAVRTALLRKKTVKENKGLRRSKERKSCPWKWKKPGCCGGAAQHHADSEKQPQSRQWAIHGNQFSLKQPV